VTAFVVAWLTVREAARRRLFIALLLITAAAVTLTAWGFAQVRDALPPGTLTSDVERQLIYAQLLILVTFMFSFVLALSAVFIAAPIVAGELESGIALALLARPVRRVEYLVGRWLGVAALVFGYAVGAGVAELVVVRLITGYAPPSPVPAIGYLCAEALVLLTLALALSTRLSAITAGVIGVAIFGLAWIGGIVGGIGVALDEPGISRVGEISRLLLPTDGLWRGVAYHLEPTPLLLAAQGAGPAAAAFPFFAAEPPSTPYLAWCAGWVVLVLGLAIVSFRRREI
jgi:ABC-type transport system involved in multi-copper enzyme maturation permease subunit